MKDKHYIIIDVGTQSLRSMIFNQNGQLLYTSSKSYQPIFNGLEVEQDPRTWKDHLIYTLKDVSEYGEKHQLTFESISVTSQRASIIPVDEHGKSLGNALMWQDRRSYEEVSIIEKRMSKEKIYLKTGLRLDSYFSGVKMLWLKTHQPEVYFAAHKIIGVQDYVIYLLTNRFVTDVSQAARTLLMNIKTMTWDDEVIEAFQIDKAILPEIVAPGSIVGQISKFIHAKTKLPLDIPVIIAGGDQQCAAIGLNVLREGVVSANTGTGSFIIAYTNQPLFDEKMRILCSASAIPGKWIIEAGVLTSGIAYTWFKDQFYQDIDEKNQYQMINQEVNDSPVGAKGLILTPHFKGSGAPYWNPISKASFYNVSLEHTRGDFARSILEGISYEMAENIDYIEDLIGYVDLIQIAGGLTKFETFNQIQCDVFNKAVSVNDVTEATAMGALITTLVTLKVHPDYETAYQQINQDQSYKTFHSIAQNVTTYLQLKKVKQYLYYALNDASIFTFTQGKSV